MLSGTTSRRHDGGRVWNRDKLDLMKAKEEKERKGIKLVLVFTGPSTPMNNITRSRGFWGWHGYGDMPVWGNSFSDDVDAQGSFLIFKLEVFTDIMTVSLSL